jgi:general secretion pathway protein A
VNRLEPLASWEIKNYIDHRLKIAGYEGGPLFTSEALSEIAQFTEGIPRNVNNFCFNALSLTCALRQKMVDLAVVQEVVSDLDISKHVPDAAPGPVSLEALPSVSENPSAPASVPEKNGEARNGEARNIDALSPAEARAYMQQLVLKLKHWEQSLKQPQPSRRHPIRTRKPSPD